MAGGSSRWPALLPARLSLPVLTLLPTYGTALLPLSTFGFIKNFQVSSSTFRYHRVQSGTDKYFQVLTLLPTYGTALVRTIKYFQVLTLLQSLTYASAIKYLQVPMNTFRYQWVHSGAHLPPTFTFWNCTHSYNQVLSGVVLWSNWAVDVVGGAGQFSSIWDFSALCIISGV